MSSFEPAPADSRPEPVPAAHELDRAAATDATDAEPESTVAATEPESTVPATAVEPTGHATEPGTPSRVASALAELDRLLGLDLAEHPDLYQRIHTELQGALSAIDDA